MEVYGGIISRQGRIILILSTIATFAFTGGYLHHLMLERDLATSRSVHHENEITSYNKCLQDVTFTELPALLSKLNEDPESNALNEVKTNTTTTTINHKGLDMTVFRGKRVALMGDSTLYYLTKWMYPLLTSLGDEVALPSYENQTLKDAASLVYKRTAKLGAGHPAAAEKPPQVIKDSNDGTWVRWMGFAGPGQHDFETKLDSMFKTAKEMKPDIIIANMGFHWLHLCPQRCPFSGKIMTISESAIGLWLDYKEHWLERIHNLALISNTSLLLFKTTNFVCEEKR